MVMKSSLSHLPANKQEELERVTKLIVETADPEKVILYGSYATGEWQEDRYVEKNTVYGFDSDYDILVVTKDGDKKKDWEITSQITNRSKYRVPINVITHDISFINNQLHNGQFFFTEIIREGVLLYDSNETKFVEPKMLTAEERKEIAQKDFDKWFTTAKSFIKGGRFYLAENDLRLAAFELHQATERTYNAILLVFTGYKPKTHNLEKLRCYTKPFSDELNSIFPKDSNQEEHIFNLLQKAYIEARYSDDYKIEKSEVEELIYRVTNLQNVAEAVCKAKIESIN